MVLYVASLLPLLLLLLLFLLLLHLLLLLLIFLPFLSNTSPPGAVGEDELGQQPGGGLPQEGAPGAA